MSSHSSLSASFRTDELFSTKCLQFTVFTEDIGNAYCSQQILLVSKFQSFHLVLMAQLFSLFCCLVHVQSALNKFTLVHELLTWSEAELYCKSNFSTSLASIHTAEEYKQTSELCEQFGGIGCWIGLSDHNSDGTFKWSDDTFIDYGSDLVSSPPWPSHEFQLNVIANSDCILIRGIAFAHVKDIGFWSSHPCESVQTYFVCNAPSEICSIGSNNWLHSVYGEMAVIDDCKFKSNNTSLHVIADKIFYSASLLEIEYVFAVNSNENAGDVGVVLDYYGECFWFYYIGISIDDRSTSVFIANVSNSNTQILQQIFMEFTLNTDQYYRLRIEVVNNSMFSVYVNDFQYFSNWICDISERKLEGLIGLKNQNNIITAKSLFISSKPHILPFIDPDQLTLNECNVTQRILPHTDTESIVFDGDLAIFESTQFESTVSGELFTEINVKENDSAAIFIWVAVVFVIVLIVICAVFIKPYLQKKGSEEHKMIRKAAKSPSKLFVANKQNEIKYSPLSKLENNSSKSKKRINKFNESIPIRRKKLFEDASNCMAHRYYVKPRDNEVDSDEIEILYDCGVDDKMKRGYPANYSSVTHYETDQNDADFEGADDTDYDYDSAKVESVYVEEEKVLRL